MICYIRCVGCPLLHQRAKKKYVAAIALLLLHSPVSIARIQHSGHSGLILSRNYKDFLESTRFAGKRRLLSCLHTSTFGQHSVINIGLCLLMFGFLFRGYIPY